MRAVPRQSSRSANDSQSIATVAVEHQPASSWTDTDLYRGEVRHGAETVLKTLQEK